MTNDEKKAFYELCSTILDIPHEWNDPVPRRTRWNNRFIGNGRFVGYGLIRVYGKQIMVTSKQGTKMFSSVDAVCEFLRKRNV
jgi:hypothetical protein